MTLVGDGDETQGDGHTGDDEPFDSNNPGTGAGGGGGDESVTGVIRPIVLKPGEDDARSLLSLYNDKNGVWGNPNNPVGGQKSLGLMLSVGLKGRIRPDMRWVTVRIQEEKDEEKHIEHPFAQSHVDYTFDLDSVHWRRLLCRFKAMGSPDVEVCPGAVETEGSPLAPGPIGPREFFVYVTRTNTLSGDSLRDANVGWNTTTPATNDPDGTGPQTATTLLGHNGKHTVHIVAFGGLRNDQPWSKSEEGGQSLGNFPFEMKPLGSDEYQAQNSGDSSLHPLKRDIRNLVVKDLTTNVSEDYFIYDITSEDSAKQQPKITFGIEDEGEPHQYLWHVYIEPTTPSQPNTHPYAVLTGVIQKPGQVQTTWDGTDGEGHLLERGTYALDVYVDEFQNANDRNSTLFDNFHLKSDLLSMADHDFEFHDTADDDADESNDEDALVKARIRYQVRDGNRGTGTTSSLKAELYDHDFKLKATHSAKAVESQLYQNIDFYTLAEQDGEGLWRVVFTGEDSHKDLWREHENHRMLAVNKPATKQYLYVMIDPGHGRVFTGTAADGSPNYIHNRVGIWSGWRGEGTNVQHASPPPAAEWQKLHEGDSALGLGQALRKRLTTGTNNKNNFRAKMTREDAIDLDDDPDTANGLRRAEALNWFNSLKAYHKAHKIKHTPHVVMISIHSNGGGTTAHGSESHYKSGQENSDASLSLAQAIHNRMTLPDNNPNKPGAGRAASNGVLAKNWTVFGGTGDYLHIPRVLVEMLYHSNTEPWAPGATIEFDLLRNGLNWTEGTASQKGHDATVSYNESWWGFTRGSRALRYGINDYFAKNKNAP